MKRSCIKASTLGLFLGLFAFTDGYAHSSKDGHERQRSLLKQVKYIFVFMQIFNIVSDKQMQFPSRIKLKATSNY